MGIVLCVGYGRQARGLSIHEVDPPPGIPAREITPLAGETLEKARTPLTQLLADLNDPTFLDRSAIPTLMEPSREAEKAYLIAREAWREGRNVDAIPRLMSAVRMAPREPAFLELLAKVYAAEGSSVAAQRYAREAIRSDPDRVSSLVFLLRLSADTNDYEQTLAVARRLRETMEDPAATDPAIQVITSRLMSQSLIHQGYYDAAIEVLEPFMDVPEIPGRNSDNNNLARALLQRSAETRLVVGDMHLRLGRYGAARESYEQAMGEPTALADIDDRLLSRLILTDLLLDDPETARDRLNNRLSYEPDSERLLELAGYLFKNNAGSEKLLGYLRAAYDASDMSEEKVIALAEALPLPEARQLLVQHHESHPGSLAITKHIIEHILLPDGVSAADHQDLDLALKLTIDDVIATDDIRETLAWVPESSSERLLVISRFDVVDAGQPERAAVAQHIRGLLLTSMPGRLDQAIEAWQTAISMNPAYQQARTALINLLIVSGQLDRAEPLIDGMDPLSDASTAAMVARLRMAQDRLDRALTVLNQAKEAGLTDTELELIRGEILLRLDEDQQAEQILVGALNQDPENERVYRVLFQLYEKQRQRDSSANRKWMALMQRVVRQLPESVTARIKLAQWHMMRRQNDRAEVILEDLLIQHPTDHLVLRAMLSHYANSKRLEQGEALIQRRLEEAPDDTQTLQEAIRFYSTTGQREKQIRAAERVLQLAPPSAQRTMQLTQIYVRNSEFDKIHELVADSAEVIEPIQPYRLTLHLLVDGERLDEAKTLTREAASRYPDQAAEIHYQHYIALWINGHEEASMAPLEAAIKADPDHAAAANSLGYALLMQDHDIDRAVRLIERAVEKEPNNGSYLDSLGWAYYKSGRFGLATAWLGRAIGQVDGDYPLLHDHLGDALYRANRTDEARSAWEKARELMRSGSWSGDPELIGLEERLDAKLQALEAGKEPETAPISSEYSDSALPAPTR